MANLALLGDNRTQAAQSALEHKVKALLARFSRQLGYQDPEHFAIRDRRVDQLVHTEFVLSANVYDCRDELREFMARNADPTWSLGVVHTTVPDKHIVSRVESLRTLSIFVPAHAEREPLGRLVVKVGLNVLCLVVVSYVLFIVFG